MDLNIVYTEVKAPAGHDCKTPVDLNVQTMREHLDNTLRKMHEMGLDTLVIYADREHGANFAYLTGFEPRFEEALLVLHVDGTAFYLLGNENLKMAQFSFLSGEVIHTPHFSLPYQPMETQSTLKELIRSAGLDGKGNVGLIGWKYFTGSLEENEKMYDIPSFIVDAIRANVPEEKLFNSSGIFLNAETGLRNIVNANELAHFEFGAAVASNAVLEAMNGIEIGKTEMEVAGLMKNNGQPITVTTICASGERFTNAVVFPRAKKIRMGDKFSLTMGLRGGLTSRAGYVASDRKDLPIEVRDYVEKVSIPYYRATVTWLSMIEIGRPCGEIYSSIEEILPKEQYHWTLNPGHYTSAEEWSSSPFYPGSEVRLRSGMMLQLDIIPSVPGYGGVSAEDGIAIADETLRARLAEDYPETWSRIIERRKYMKNELGINLSEDVLPMSDTLGYLRPLLLAKDRALRVM